MRGGARVCRGDIYNPDYNAMEEEYHNWDEDPNGISPGAQSKNYRKKGSETSDNVTLHVSNIPTSLTEKGLLNIFASDGGNPIRAYIGKSRNDCPFAQPGTTWGFVDFKTLSEAHAAISALNRKPPHNLNVKFSHSEEQKLDKERNRSNGQDRDSDSDRGSITPMTRGRGHLPPMKGKSPSNFRSTRAQDEPFYEDQPKQQNYSNNQFSHPNSSYEVNVSNAVHSPYAEGIYDDGNRKMSMGRGSFISTVERQSALSSTSSRIPRDKYIFEEVTDEMDTKVAAYISKRFKELSCDENFKLSSEMRLSLPFKLGQCAYCSRPSIYCCSRCKEWYCCNSCRFDDFPQHKKTCVPRSIIFDKSGYITYSNVPDEFADAEETPMLMKPRDNRPSIEDRSSRSIQDNSDRSTRSAFHQEDKRDRNSTGFRETNGYDNGSMDVRNGEPGSREYQRDRNQHKDSNRDSRDQQRNRGPRNSNDNNRGGQRTSRGGGRSDRRNLDPQNEVYVRPPISPPRSSMGFVEEKNTPLKDLQEPPIPLNVFTEVTVGSLGNGTNEFFAYSKFDYQKQKDMMETLGELCAESSPINGRIEINTKVCAPFGGMWFRAQVKKFVQSKAEVFFIDFGNTATLEKQELRPLSSDLASKPAMAHKYILAESPENPTINEEAAYKLKPIKQDQEGRWVVQVEGVTYDSLQELDDGTLLCDAVSSQSVSGGYADKTAVKHLLFNLNKNKTPKILIEKVMNEDFLTGCILPEEGTFPFKELSKILKNEVVTSETIGLNRGMMVAVFWDNDWYRGYVMLIRGEDPVIALTDRGRVVVPQAVAPLPEKVNRIPESGIRAIFKDPIKDLDMSGKTLSLNNIRVDGDKVRVEVETLGEAVLVPWEPLIEEAGLSSIKLVSGIKVVISAYVSPTAVYVQSSRPLDITLRAEIMQDIAAHCLKCGPLKRKPLCGEFLAVRFSEDGNYYRGQIFRRQGDKYKVTFVDYGNSEVVSISDMKPLLDSLKSMPCCAVKVGLKGVPDVPFNTQCMRYLNELSANVMELFLAFDEDLGSVTLTLRNGEVVNKVLADLLKPTWDQPNFSPYKGQVFMESDLIYEEWHKDEKFQIAPVRVLGPDKIIVLRTSSDLLIHIESNLIPKITKYCEQFPQETYNPRQSEVCLAKFHEDEKWYRALCTKSFSHNAAEIFYVDYGNSGEVLHRCIRKMVPEFMETPVALKVCKVYGFTEKLSKEAEKRLTNFYMSQRLDAVVIDDKSERPVLWIPALQDLAKELGFNLKSP